MSSYQNVPEKYVREDTNDTSVFLSPKKPEGPLRVEFPSTHVDSRETVFHGLSREIRSIPGNTFLDLYQRDREQTGESAVFNLNFDVYGNKRPEGFFDVFRYFRDVWQSQKMWWSQGWHHLGKQSQAEHIHNPHVEIYRADPLSSLSITFRASAIMFIVFSIVWVVNPSDGYEAISTLYTLFARKMLGTMAVLQAWSHKYNHFALDLFTLENHKILRSLVYCTFSDIAHTPTSFFNVLTSSEAYTNLFGAYQFYLRPPSQRYNVPRARTMYMPSVDEDVYRPLAYKKLKKAMAIAINLDPYRDRPIPSRKFTFPSMDWLIREYRYPRMIRFNYAAIMIRRKRYTRRMKFFLDTWFYYKGRMPKECREKLKGKNHWRLSYSYNFVLQRMMSRRSLYPNHFHQVCAIKLSYSIPMFHYPDPNPPGAVNKGLHIYRRFVNLQDPQNLTYGVTYPSFSYGYRFTDRKMIFPNHLSIANVHCNGWRTESLRYSDPVEFPLVFTALRRFVKNVVRQEIFLNRVKTLFTFEQRSSTQSLDQVLNFVTHAQFIWLIPVALITVHAVHGVAHMFMDQSIGTDDVRTRASVWSILERVFILLILGIL